MVPSKFYEARIKFQLGEAKEVLFYLRAVKADKAGQAFSLLLPRFSFEQRKACRMRMNKVDFVNYKTPENRAFLHKENFV